MRSKHILLQQDRLRNRRKSLLFLCLLPAVLAFLFQGAEVRAAQQTKEGKFQIQVEYGYAGLSSYNASIPIELSILNEGENFEGRVELQFADDDYSEGVSYSQELLLSGGAERKLFFLLPANSSRRSIQIVIKDAKDKEIFSQKETPNISLTDGVIMGVLSDDFNGLNYLDRLGSIRVGNFAGQPVHLLNMKETGIPEIEGGLDMLSLLVINNYDTALLSEGQREALKGWILKGGTLILGTGSHYQKTLGMFGDDFLTGTIGNLKMGSLDLLTPQSQTDSEENSLSLNRLDIVVEDSISYDFMGLQIAERGRGRVAVISFDLGDEKFSDWPYAFEFMDQMLLPLWQELVQVTDYSGNLNYWSIQNMVANTISDAMPRVSLFVVIIVFYIIFLPIIYLILARKDKRHYIWWLVPALSVCTSVLIFAMGTGTRQSKPFLNYATYILMQDNGYGEEINYVSSISPNNNPYKFTVPGSYRLSNISGSDYYSNPHIGIDIMQKAGENEISILKQQSYNQKFFSMVKTDQVLGNIEVRLAYQNGFYTGFVENHTDYKINMGGLLLDLGFYAIGDLSPGEKREIDIDTDDLMKTEGNISAYLIPYTGRSRESDFNDSAKRNMISNMASVLSPGSVYNSFIGFAEGYIPEAMEKQEYKVSGNAMVLVSFEVQYALEGQRILNDIREYEEIIEGEFGQYYYDSRDTYWMESLEGVIEYDFGEDFLPETVVCDFGEYSFYREEVEIYFYHCESETYQRVLDQQDIFSVEMAPYLNEDNVLRVRFRAVNTYGGCNIPKFMIIGTDIE